MLDYLVLKAFILAWTDHLSSAARDGQQSIYAFIGYSSNFCTVEIVSC